MVTSHTKTRVDLRCGRSITRAENKKTHHENDHVITPWVHVSDAPRLTILGLTVTFVNVTYGGDRVDDYICERYVSRRRVDGYICERYVSVDGYICERYVSRREGRARGGGV